MKITVVSAKWPVEARTGVQLAAALHVKLLKKQGHTVSIIGASPYVLHEDLPVNHRLYVPSTGSGALYSPISIDKSAMVAAIKSTQPDIVVIEGWQTSLTDSAINVAKQLSIPILLISHGVSVHPFTLSAIDLIRSIGWAYYRIFKLPKLIERIDVLAVLSLRSNSKRFYDREIATKKNKKVSLLLNAPANIYHGTLRLEDRKNQIIVVGYFSPIKNQLKAIRLLARIDKGIKMVFIGEKHGRYYERCLSEVTMLGLSERVMFFNDSEVNIGEEIGRSKVLLSTSKTEVLPIVLLEAMAMGTPYVAPSVGCIPELTAGFVANSTNHQINIINQLFDDDELWKRHSNDCIKVYLERYTEKSIEKQLNTCLLMTEK